MSDVAVMDFSERDRQKFELRRGDLLICEGGEPGRSAVWNEDIPDCYYQKALHRLRPYAGIADAKFLAHWLHFQADIGAFVDQNAKTTIAHLPLVRLHQLQIPNIGFEKQRQIAAHLKAQLAEVDKARQAAEVQLREINLLPQKILAQAFGDVQA